MACDRIANDASVFARRQRTRFTSRSRGCPPFPITARHARARRVVAERQSSPARQVEKRMRLAEVCLETVTAGGFRCVRGGSAVRATFCLFVCLLVGWLASK